MLEPSDDVSAPPTPSCSPAELRIAVSIKQPWATFVVHGLKSIEIRKWRPKRHGVVYVHTGANADDSDEAWAKLPPSLASFAKLRRGVVGRVQIVGTKRYDSLESFREDRDRHLAPDDWYADAGLFGWLLESPETLPFEPRPGNLRLFRI